MTWTSSQKNPKRPMQDTKTPHFCEQIPVCSATCAWQRWFLGWVATTSQPGEKGLKTGSTGSLRPSALPRYRRNWMCQITH